MAHASGNLFERNLATVSDVDISEVGFLIAEETHDNALRSNTSVGQANQGFTIVGGSHNTLESNASLGAYDTCFGLIEESENLLADNRVDESDGVRAPHVGFSIYFGSDGNTLRSNRTTANNEAGFLIVESSANHLERNTTQHVAGHGFVVDGGAGNEYLMNRSIHNTLYGFLDQTEGDGGAGEPFFVRHGWGLDSGDMKPPASFWFDLEVDGVPVEGGGEVTQGGCSFGEDWCQLRVTTFNFSDGLPARAEPNAFVGHWYSSCEWAVSNIEGFDDPCDKPNTPVVAFSFGRDVLVLEP